MVAKSEFSQRFFVIYIEGYYVQAITFVTFIFEN